jgi:hypothetical protein
MQRAASGKKRPVQKRFPADKKTRGGGDKAILTRGSGQFPAFYLSFPPFSTPDIRDGRSKRNNNK